MQMNKQLMECWNRMFKEGGRYKEIKNTNDGIFLIFYFNETKEEKIIKLNLPQYFEWKKIKPKIK